MIKVKLHQILHELSLKLLEKVVDLQDKELLDHKNAMEVK